MIDYFDQFDDDDDAAAIGEAEDRISRRFVLGLLEVHAATLEPGSNSAAGRFATHLLAETAAGIETLLSLQRRTIRPDARLLVEFGGILHDICEQIECQMGALREFDLALDVAPACNVPAGHVVRLSLIASELIINAIKHPHPAGAPGLVEVGCVAASDGSVVLTVCDDGIGLPVGFDPRCDGGFGMAMIRSMVRHLGAILTYESTGLGLMVTVSIPPPSRRH